MIVETEPQLDQSNELDGVVETPEPTTQTPPAQSDDLREAVRSLVELQQKQSEPKPAEPTPEEVEKQWGIYNPEAEDKDFFRKFLRVNTDMDAAEIEKAVNEFKPVFAAMQKGLVRQSIVGARNLFMAEMDKFRKEFEPVKGYAEQQQSEARRGRFFDAYPGLSDERFGKVIGAAAKDLADKTFADENEYFKALAESAAETIKGVLPEFVLDTKPQKTPAKAGAGTTPRLPRMSVGGTGGAGGAKPKTDDSRGDDSSSLF